MIFSKLRTSLILGGISLYMLFLPISLISQTNLNPDSVFHGTSAAQWLNDLTNIASVQGNVYVFSWQSISAYATKVAVFKIDHHGNLAPYNMGSEKVNYFYYGYGGEGAYTPDVHGPSITFQFNGQLWHYTNLMANGTLFHPATDSYDCFARLPIPNTDEPVTFYDFISGSPTVRKKGAFQHDSTLYFLGVYAKSNDPNYKKWCLQKYTYNNVENKFIYSSTIPMLNISGDSFGGYIEHIDSTGRHRLLIHTFTRGQLSSSVGYIDATTSGGQTTFTYTLLPYVATPPTYASVILPGSIKGCRTPDQMVGIDYPDRFTIFGMGSNCVLKYYEYMFYYDDPGMAGGGNVVLASSLTPAKVNDKYYIQGTFELVPTRFHANVNNDPDGFRQQVWAYYPDNNRKICGARFLSDAWRFIPDSTVSSYDLADDSLYGPQIKSMWTLAGIIDGGPPCSIDWPTWSNHHNSMQKPTDLKFVQTTVSKTEITTTSDEQYTVGTEFKTDFKHLNFGMETKFSDSYKNTVTNSTKITNEITKTYELNEEGQEFGVYIYAVPSITRYMYQVYPWYDNANNHPVPFTTQYRLVVTGVALVDRPCELSEYPFQVHEPNSANLASWKHSGRVHHQSALLASQLQPVCTPSWTSPFTGDIGTFEIVTDSITEFEHKSTYSIEASFSGTKPEVFEAKVSAGMEVSYSTATKNETELGTKLEVSLANLTEESLGVNCGQLILETYWFKPEDFDWWFYDSLGDERPWYIAYMVNYVGGKVILTAPATEEVARSKGKLFSWDATGFEPKEYRLLFSSSPHITPSSTIRSINAGSSMNYYVSELPSDVEKLYWAVMAVTDEGEIVWSESRLLKVGGEEVPDIQDGNLIAVPYPNPGKGTGIHLFVDTKEIGKMQVRIISVNGTTVYGSVLDHSAEGPHTYDFPQLNLSRGLYIMELTINNERTIKKLTVL